MMAQIFLDYLVKYIFKDQRTAEHRKFRVVLACVTTFAFLVAWGSGIYKDREALEKDRRTKKYETNLLQDIDQLHKDGSNLSTQVQSLTASNGELRAQICDLTRAMSDLVLANVSKPELDIGTRSEMLAVKKKLDLGDVCISDLGALVAGWSNRVAQIRIDREKGRKQSVEEQRKLLSPVMPVWDYTIRTFQTKLATHLKQLGSRATSDYSGLPSIESLSQGWLPETPWSPDISTNVCAIELGTNPNWRCTGWIQRNPRMGQNGGMGPHLHLNCKGTNWTEELVVQYEKGKISTGISGGDVPSFGDSFPIEDYQKKIDSLLDDFIGAQADTLIKAVSPQNESPHIVRTKGSK
jgi:hypothetical protein